jgi:hypothetical protein
VVSLRFASLALFVLSIAGQASAAGEVIALEYSAPASCPSAAEFEAQIRSFVPSVSVLPRAASARVFEVSIEESGTFGQLRLLTEQNAGSRLARGVDCAEVARLLAFAVALVLDPQLQMEEQTAPPENQTFDALPLDPGILPRPLPAFVGPPAPLAQKPASTAGPRPRWPKQSLAAVGSIASASSPTPSYGVGALYGISAAFGSFTPQMRLGASYSRSADASRDGATVKFVHFLGAIEGCPTALHAGVVELWPCLRVDLGARRTKASGIPDAKDRVRPWLSFDALLHARFRLASPVFLELGGGVMLPAIHDRVFFRPDIEVHQVPALGVFGQIALGFEFADRNSN